MSQKLFTSACQALWGPVYQSTAARELKLGRSTVVRYDAGDRDVPADVLEKLFKLLVARQREIERLLKPLDRAIPKVA